MAKQGGKFKCSTCNKRYADQATAQKHYNETHLQARAGGIQQTQEEMPRQNQSGKPQQDQAGKNKQRRATTKKQQQAERNQPHQTGKDRSQQIGNNQQQPVRKIRQEQGQKSRQDQVRKNQQVQVQKNRPLQVRMNQPLQVRTNQQDQPRTNQQVQIRKNQQDQIRKSQQDQLLKNQKDQFRKALQDQVQKAHQDLIRKNRQELTRRYQQELAQKNQARRTPRAPASSSQRMEPTQRNAKYALRPARPVPVKESHMGPPPEILARNVEGVPTKEPKVPVRIPCRFCPDLEEFKSLASFDQHNEIYHRKIYKCPLCPAALGWKKMRDHLKDAHGAGRRWKTKRQLSKRGNKHRTTLERISIKWPDTGFFTSAFGHTLKYPRKRKILSSSALENFAPLTSDLLGCLFDTNNLFADDLPAVSCAK